MTTPAQLGLPWPDPPLAQPTRLYRTFTDDAGNVYPMVRVNLYQPGTTTPLAERAFKDIAMSVPLEDNSVWTPGIIEIWFPSPLRLRIEFTPLNGARQYIEDVDVLPDPATIVRSVSPLALEAIDASQYLAGTLLVATQPTGGTFTPPPVQPMTVDEYTGLDERIGSLEGLTTGQSAQLPHG